MCRWFQCEMLIDDEPIKVVDFPASSPFDQELFHFEEGYRCQFNGRESLVVEDLQSGRCRLRRWIKMAVAYNNSMYTLDVPDLEEDTSLCEDCPYRFGVCWKQGYCLVEDVN